MCSLFNKALMSVAICLFVFLVEWKVFLNNAQSFWVFLESNWPQLAWPRLDLSALLFVSFAIFFSVDPFLSNTICLKITVVHISKGFFSLKLGLIVVIFTVVMLHPHIYLLLPFEKRKFCLNIYHLFSFRSLFLYKIVLLWTEGLGMEGSMEISGWPNSTWFAVCWADK